METFDLIQKAVNYIEDNLKNDISIVKVANAIGYSEYYFLRVFKTFVGLTPADYIRKRRISEIVSHMEIDSRPISDIAFEYGFNSKENFTRAFKSEHHILPTEFKRCKNSLELYSRFKLADRNTKYSYDIEELDSFTAVVYPCDEKLPSNFWNKYNAHGYSKRLTGGISTVDYGISRWNHEKGKLDYWIGVKEESAKGDIIGTVRLELSGGLYAVFKTPPSAQFDFVNNIHRTWNYIKEIWFINSPYERRDDYEFECYIEESRLFSETIYIPIKIKNNNT